MSTDQTEQFGRVSSNVDASAPAIIDFSRGGDRAEEFIVRFDAELANVMIKACESEFRRLGGPITTLNLPTAKDAVFALLGLHVARQMSTSR